MAYRRMLEVQARQLWRFVRGEALDVSWIYDAMSRIRYLVSYDICDPKRLRRVAKVLEGFGAVAILGV